MGVPRLALDVALAADLSPFSGPLKLGAAFPQYREYNSRIRSRCDRCVATSRTFYRVASGPAKPPIPGCEGCARPCFIEGVHPKVFETIWWT